MAYTPRPCTWQTCPVCQVAFAARHRRRLYCSPSCNVRASYARTGRRRTRATPLATAPTPAESGARPMGTIPVALVPPRPVTAPRPAAAAPTMHPATAACVTAFCDELAQLWQRNQAEQLARSQSLDRLLQPYR